MDVVVCIGVVLCGAVFVALVAELRLINKPVKANIFLSTEGLQAIRKKSNAIGKIFIQLLTF